MTNEVKTHLGIDHRLFGEPVSLGEGTATVRFSAAPTSSKPSSAPSPGAEEGRVHHDRWEPRVSQLLLRAKNLPHHIEPIRPARAPPQAELDFGA